ncbi:MAG TPA: DUF6476 family protein [Stellaceae bacterium]|jgi:hypothetical protein|nr:DUF6476 family protein [Stellaceae bacterium]
MRALKILVAVMGAMILAGVAVLGATVAGRMSKGTPPAAAYAAAPVEIPAGAHVEAMSTGADRVVLALALADGTRQLVIVDLATGKKLGVIPLRPTP